MASEKQKNAETEYADFREVYTVPEFQVQTVRQRSPMHYPQLFLFHALVVVTILWIMFRAVFGLVTAPTNDMYPRIDSGDLLLYYRLDKEIRPQEIVVFDKNDTIYVGRVIAAGGDTVEITDDEKLVINGSTMIESNIFEPTPRYEGFVEYPLKLKQDEYFILVDSRASGEDSRYFGVVKKSEMLGTVITIVRRTNL